MISNILTVYIETTQNSMFNILCFFLFMYRKDIHRKRKDIFLCFWILEHRRTRLRSLRLCENSLKLIQAENHCCAGNYYPRHVAACLAEAGFDVCRVTGGAILKPCKIIHEIHIPLNFSFRF